LRILLFNLLLILGLNALNVPKYFSADFVQKIHSDKSVLIYRGKIYTDSNSVFWKYTYPNEKEIWINKKVYVYEPDLYQVTISKKPEFNLFAALKKAKKLKKSEYTTKINGKTVHFIFDKKLENAWYIDDVGNRVEISFLNQNTKKIPEGIFQPKYPKDVDFIYKN